MPQAISLTARQKALIEGDPEDADTPVFSYELKIKLTLDEADFIWKGGKVATSVGIDHDGTDAADFTHATVDGAKTSHEGSILINIDKDKLNYVEDGDDSGWYATVNIDLHVSKDDDDEPLELFKLKVETFNYKEVSGVSTGYQALVDDDAVLPLDDADFAIDPGIEEWMPGLDVEKLFEEVEKEQNIFEGSDYDLGGISIPEKPDSGVREIPPLHRDHSFSEYGGPEDYESEGAEEEYHYEGEVQYTSPITEDAYF